MHPVILGDDVRTLDRRHRARGLKRIGFHYVIRDNGWLEAGQRDSRAGRPLSWLQFGFRRHLLERRGQN